MQLPSVLRTGLAQFMRYMTVGLLNTGIDLLITNLLVIFIGATTDGQLLIISLFASSCATINSYFCNRRWTYEVDVQALPRYAFMRFFGIALIAMLANTSVFLFTYQMLMSRWEVSRLLAVNLAKLFGISMGCLVGFFGYRVGVFELAGMRQFRSAFRFDQKTARFSLTQQCLALIMSAVCIRLVYLAITTAITGGAVNYAESAESLATGHFNQVNLFWNSLFSYWEALFRMLGLSVVNAAIVASFIPGVLLLAPVTILARFLYGETVAWLAGWMTVFHPRFVEYSCNGMPDSLILLLSTCGLTSLTLVLSVPRGRKWLFAAGFCFGLYFCTQLQSLPIIVLYALIGWWGRSKESALANRLWAYVMGLTLGFVSSASLYSALTFWTTGGTDTSMQVQEFLLPMLHSEPSYFPHYIANNVMWTMSSIPGVLLSPLWFFAVLLPLFYRFRKRVGSGRRAIIDHVNLPFAHRFFVSIRHVISPAYAHSYPYLWLSRHPGLQ